ncbi:MAG: hypothetical protein V4584_12995 [Verrucomicrobiota bacterium]
MISTFLKCAALAMTVSLASAQNEGRGVSARLVYFEQSSGDPSELFFNRNGEFVKCSPSGSVGITPVTCPVDASGKVVFTRTGGPDQVVATATVPASVSEAVFFFLRNPASAKGAPYQILVADESLKTLPKGGSFVCNLTPRTARVSLGEARYVLLPGKPVFVKRPEQKDAYNMAPLQMQIQAEGEEWKNLKDTMLRFSDNERYFIVTHMEGGKQPTVKIYKQVVQEKAAPAAP